MRQETHTRTRHCLSVLNPKSMPPSRESTSRTRLPSPDKKNVKRFYTRYDLTSCHWSAGMRRRCDFRLHTRLNTHTKNEM